jgi:putative membrane-bound dehydrogenase-like protein
VRPIVFFVVCFCLSATGQLEMLPADEFPQPTNSEQDRSVQPMPPAEAAATFQVPSGVQTTLFAAEPEVQNPIAMSWDARGRLWIAENYTYAERSQRFDLTLRDRVIILEDENGDGIADRRQVFTDDVQILTGIEVGHGGVWLMCPPRLLWIPDDDLDGVPDGPARVVLDGFDIAEDNYHNFANGLKWGPDGWLYGRCGGSCPGRVGSPGTPADQRVPLEGGIWRYDVHRNHFEVLVHGTTNPWGHDWDQWGECFFVNTVNGHLWHLIPGAHCDRPFTLDPNPWVFQLLDMHADHWHFDRDGQWFESRDGAANDYGGGHAHIGAVIYQADNWPAEYRNRLLTWNMHGRRANQEILQRSGSGYVATHAEDCLLAEDPFFRGIDLSVGPDGAVYGIDWSDTGECHEHTGVHRTSGRVYRFHYGQPPRKNRVDLVELSSIQLADLHSHSNEWFVRQSRLILAGRARSNWLQEGTGREESSEIAPLDEAVHRLEANLQGTDAHLAYQSLMTLHAMGRELESTLERLLDHSNEHLRVWAVRLLLDEHPIDDIFGRNPWCRPLSDSCLQRLVDLAYRDPSGLVRLSLASGLQRLPLESRVPLAGALMSRAEDANDHNLPLIVWYGLMPVAEAMPEQAARLAIESTWPKTQRFLARRVASLIEQDQAAVDLLVASCISAPEETRWNLLSGIADGLQGFPRAPEPANWQALVEAVNHPVQIARDQRLPDLRLLVGELSIVFGDGRAMQEIASLVADEQADISLRRSALETLVATDSPGLESLYGSLLKDARLNAIAAKGLARSSDDRVAEMLIENYYRIRSPQRPSIIALLSTRVGFAHQLLDAVSGGRIPLKHLSAYDVRQMMALGDQGVVEKAVEVWGDIRQSDEEKRAKIVQLKGLLAESNDESGEPSRGRQLFQQRCALCHRLFGSGNAIGPDLTGANRSNWDYLLDNIVDPSGVVSKDYRMSLIQLADGRLLSGLILTRTPQTVELQTQTDRLTLPVEDIEEIRLTTLSPMPDGLLDDLSDQQLRDLFAYLRHPTQVPLPDEKSSVP